MIQRMGHFSDLIKTDESLWGGKTENVLRIGGGTLKVKRESEKTVSYQRRERDSGHLSM